MTSHFTQADTLIPNPANPLDWNRYAYVRYNPLRYVDPSGHTPACGFSYSDPECEKPEINNPSKKMKAEVLHNLAGGDETLYNIWQNLYVTESGHDLAIYIYKHKIQMAFWGNTHSETQCTFHGCAIYISQEFMFSETDTNSSTSISAAIAELGHEAYHATVWRPATDGDWVKNFLRNLGFVDAGVNNSQLEEAMAAYVYDQIYFELTGKPPNPYDSLRVTDPQSLRNWTRTYNDQYRHLPPYPR